MQHLLNGYRGLELLFELNLDRLAAILVLAASLFLAAYVGHG
ncbi:MAG: hypothetical protein QNJ35_03880 [Paracoccaceae bacterium]|nr:hypothetical protein [Paracoccaceae bacterium]